MAIQAPGFKPAARPVNTKGYSRTFQKGSAPDQPGDPAPPAKPVEAALPYERTSNRWLQDSALAQVGKALQTSVPKAIGQVDALLEHERDKIAKDFQYELYSMDDKEAEQFYSEQERLLGPNHKKALREQFALRMGFSVATRVQAGIKSGQIDLAQTDIGDVLSAELDPFLAQHDDPTIHETIKEQIGQILPKLREEQNRTLAAKQQEKAFEGFYGTALGAIQAGLAADANPEEIAGSVRQLYSRFGPGTDLNLSHATMDEAIIAAATWAADKGHRGVVDALLSQPREGTDGKTIPPIGDKAKYLKQVAAIRQTAESREADRLSDVNHGFLVELQTRAAMGEDVSPDLEANPWIKEVMTDTQIARLQTVSRKAAEKQAQELRRAQIDSELQDRVSLELEGRIAEARVDPASLWEMGDMQVISNLDPSQMKTMGADEVRDHVARVYLGDAADPGFDPREKPQVTSSAVSFMAQSGYKWNDLIERMEVAPTLVNSRSFTEGRAPEAAKRAMTWYREFKAQGALSALSIDKETAQFFEAVSTLEKSQFAGDTDAAMLQVARMKENPVKLGNTSAASRSNKDFQESVQTIARKARKGLPLMKEDIQNPSVIERDLRTSMLSLLEMGFGERQAREISTRALEGQYENVNGFVFNRGNLAIPPGGKLQDISRDVAQFYLDAGLGDAFGIDDPDDLALVPDTVGDQSVWSLVSKTIGPIPNASRKVEWQLGDGTTRRMPIGRFSSGELRFVMQAQKAEAIEQIERRNEAPEAPSAEPTPEPTLEPTPEPDVNQPAAPQGDMGTLPGTAAPDTQAAAATGELSPEEMAIEPEEGIEVEEPSPRASRVWPLPIEGRVSSDYGMRMHPIDKVEKMHHGIDIAAKQGTPINAVASGVVKFAGVAGGYGNMVEIEHSDGHVSRYAHAHTLDVKPGQRVEAGEPIATVGSTGKSTGPHLHFEVRKPDGSSVNPTEHQIGQAQTQSPAQSVSSTDSGIPRLLYAYQTPALKSARDLFKKKGDPLWEAFDQELARRGEE